MTGAAARVTKQDVGTCGCGKRMYPTRKLARRQRDADGQRMRAYQCGSYWHATSQSAARAGSYRDYGMKP